MKTENEFTPVIIECPECKTVQAAIVEKMFPFNIFIHTCVNEKCNYLIMESEFDIKKPFVNE
jgi:ssDNA-binding Zn-finger/Zn-ribbon topoisomerase 1